MLQARCEFLPQNKATTPAPLLPNTLCFVFVLFEWAAAGALPWTAYRAAEAGLSTWCSSQLEHIITPA